MRPPHDPYRERNGMNDRETNCDPKFLKEFLSNHMLEYPVDENGVVMLNKEPEFRVISKLT